MDIHILKSCTPAIRKPTTMATMSKVCVLLVLLISQSLYSTSHKNHNGGQVDVSRILSSLEKVVDFYARNIDKVNLDSIFGLRVAEGCITKILNEFQNGNDRETRLLRTRMTSLLKTVKKMAIDALPHLNEYQPEYYRKFKPIVESPWMLFEDFRKLNMNVKRKSTLVDGNGSFNGKNFNERISDKCMTELMGTAAGQKNSCNVSVDCLKIMTSPKLRHYGNTHQVLYFLLGFETGCRHILEREMKKSPHHWGGENRSSNDNFLEKKCEQIFHEMKALEPNVVSNGNTDLFLEQGLVCGILGFKDFLSRETLRNIINWQDRDHGCFGTEMNQVL